jgi:hypothetical protein
LPADSDDYNIFLESGEQLVISEEDSEHNSDEGDASEESAQTVHDGAAVEPWWRKQVVGSEEEALVEEAKAINADEQREAEAEEESAAARSQAARGTSAAYLRCAARWPSRHAYAAACASHSFQHAHP